MIIEDKYELITLHRCIMEAKFTPDPNDFDIAGSPIAAKIANMIVDELEVIDGEKWAEWRLAQNHQDKINNLVKALKFHRIDSTKKHSERKELILNALAPLVADELLVEKLIIEVFEST